ncbi:MAG: hypothetical protein V2J10_10765 [Wenzhouxiangella sp.]|jgi:hypothetical protein|nr:hypothetical protein [Wenzhouxiangella sp.]
MNWEPKVGHLTVGKAAQVKGMTIDDRQSLVVTHGIPVTFDP